MAEELKFQVRKVQKAAKDLRSLHREVAGKLSHPIIIAMKGHPYTGRRLVSLFLAATLSCPLIKEDDIGENTTKQYPLTLNSMDGIHEQADPASFLVVCRIALSQIKLGLSVVIDSELCCQFQFNKLKSLAKETETPLIIIECQSRDVSELWQSIEGVEEPSSLEDLRSLLDEFNTHSDYEVADIPKFLVDITPAGDIKNCVSFLLQSIVTHVESGQRIQIAKCKCHELVFWDVEKENQAMISCNDCLQHISGPIYRCNKCYIIFHRSCTDLPPLMELPSDKPFPLKLADEEDLKSEARCNCCNELIKGYFYIFHDYLPFVDRRVTYRLDLNCIFLPFKRRTKFHEHQLELSFVLGDFECDVCGIRSDQKVCYTCCQCPFRIDPNCAWLPETAVYERHRHPFKLVISPQDDSDQYYCNACEKERDPKYWIYYCADCDFPAHTRCLVPSALPTSESDNK